MAYLSLQCYSAWLDRPSYLRNADIQIRVVGGLDNPSATSLEVVINGNVVAQGGYLGGGMAGHVYLVSGENNSEPCAIKYSPDQYEREIGDRETHLPDHSVKWHVMGRSTAREGGGFIAMEATIPLDKFNWPMLMLSERYRDLTGEARIALIQKWARQFTGEFNSIFTNVLNAESEEGLPGVADLSTDNVGIVINSQDDLSVLAFDSGDLILMKMVWLPNS